MPSSSKIQVSINMITLTTIHPSGVCSPHDARRFPVTLNTSGPQAANPSGVPPVEVPLIPSPVGPTLVTSWSGFSNEVPDRGGSGYPPPRGPWSNPHVAQAKFMDTSLGGVWSRCKWGMGVMEGACEWHVFWQLTSEAGHSHTLVHVDPSIFQATNGSTSCFGHRTWLRQKEIQDVAHKLKESNKSLCRNLKENPNVQAGWNELFLWRTPE